MGHGERQLAAGRNQRSGVKLISDLRLLISVIGDFNDLPFTDMRCGMWDGYSKWINTRTKKI
jgi:hypothetical protein